MTRGLRILLVAIAATLTGLLLVLGILGAIYVVLTGSHVVYGLTLPGTYDRVDAVVKQLDLESIGELTCETYSTDGLFDSKVNYLAIVSGEQGWPTVVDRIEAAGLNRWPSIGENDSILHFDRGDEDDYMDVGTMLLDAGEGGRIPADCVAEGPSILVHITDG